MQVVVFAEDRDWHCARLVTACRARGADVALESLRACRFRLGGEGPGIEIPALGECLQLLHGIDECGHGQNFQLKSAP